MEHYIQRKIKCDMARDNEVNIERVTKHDMERNIERKM
jgi:hypothetical protein